MDFISKIKSLVKFIPSFLDLFKRKKKPRKDVINPIQETKPKSIRIKDLVDKQTSRRNQFSDAIERTESIEEAKRYNKTENLMSNVKKAPVKVIHNTRELTAFDRKAIAEKALMKNAKGKIVADTLKRAIIGAYWKAGKGKDLEEIIKLVDTPMWDKLRDWITQHKNIREYFYHTDTDEKGNVKHDEYINPIETIAKFEGDIEEFLNSQSDESNQ